MNNHTLCKVSPLGCSFCARSHTGFFLGGYYVMWTTYLEGLLDKKKKNNHERWGNDSEYLNYLKTTPVLVPIPKKLLGLY